MINGLTKILKIATQHSIPSRVKNEDEPVLKNQSILMVLETLELCLEAVSGTQFNLLSPIINKIIYILKMSPSFLFPCMRYFFNSLDIV